MFNKVKKIIFYKNLLWHVKLLRILTGLYISHVLFYLGWIFANFVRWQPTRWQPVVVYSLLFDNSRLDQSQQIELSTYSVLSTDCITELNCWFLYTVIAGFNCMSFSWITWTDIEYMHLSQKEKEREKQNKTKTRPSRQIRCAVWIVKRMRYQPTDRPTDQRTKPVIEVRWRT